jgi:hypothetical protein
MSNFYLGTTTFTFIYMALKGKLVSNLMRELTGRETMNQVFNPADERQAISAPVE